MDCSLPLYTNGRYRVVVWTKDREGRDPEPGDPVRFAVVDGAGVRVRDELTLDDAKAWIERYVDEDQRQREPVVSRPRSRRGRR